MEIQLVKYGKTLGPRALGAKLKDNILEKYRLEEQNVVFKFNGVENLSTGFAKELFGELYIEIGDDFSRVISFQFDSSNNKKLFIQAINRGIKASIDNQNRRR